ncbi:unnamed protein product [Closterium sp. NIES-53]
MAWQRGKWDVRSFSLMPGVFLLQQPDDFACVLLIQDACYVHMTGGWCHVAHDRWVVPCDVAHDGCAVPRGT